MPGENYQAPGKIKEPSYLNYELLTVMWSAKESVFKWYSLGGIDFKEHIQLNHPIQQNKNSVLPFVFKKDSLIALNITAKIFDNLVLTWVIK